MDNMQKKALNGHKVDVKGVLHFKAPFERGENEDDKKTGILKCKSSKAVGVGNRKASVSVEKHLLKDHELLGNRGKASLDLKRKGKDLEKVTVKTMRGRKIEDVQSPLNRVQKVSVEPHKMRSPETEKKLNTKQETLNTFKVTEKRKVKTNRPKIIKSSIKSQNLKPKKQTEELLLRDKERKLSSTLKPKKVTFDSSREKVIISLKPGSQNTSSRSNLSVSESAEWVNLNFDKYGGGPSDFVGEFLEKLNVDHKKIDSKPKIEEKKSDQDSLSSYSESVGLPPSKPASQKPRSQVPPLALSKLNTKPSVSSRFCEEDGVIYDSKDSIFKGIFSTDSKNNATQSSRTADNHKASFKPIY